MTISVGVIVNLAINARIAWEHNICQQQNKNEKQDFLEFTGKNLKARKMV